jgi:multiple sugar transport system ATP-binding protein
MSAVRLSGAMKAFGPVEVLKGIDLDIADGEFVVFVGPSGCGKSTLLRAIAGLESLTAGSIEIGDRRVDGVPPSERGIAMVFQSYALYPHLTVRENMGFALKLAGRPKAAIAAAVAEAARILDIDHLLDRRPRDLSGGQRQRVAIGRAIVREPQVFLFDEPLSNLDAALRVRMRYEFAALHRTLGTTMIYVTHDQVEAMTLADRIVVLNGGEVEQVGTPAELYDEPATRFVAGFIGSPTMNLLPATLVENRPGGAIVRLANGQEVATARDPDGRVAGTPLTLGVRPDHLSPTALGNRLSGTIRLVESLGSVHHVHVVVEGLAEPLVTSLPARPDGAVLALGFEPHRAHLFDIDGHALARAVASAPRAAA